MEVRPFGKEYRQAEERGQGAGGSADAALSFQQRQIIAATFKLVRDRARVPGTQWGQDVATLALMQGRLHDQVQSLVRRMASRGVAEPGSGFAKTSDALRAATVEMASAKGQLESKKAREALTPEQAALKHLYLTIVSLDPTGRGRRRWTNRWKAALNAFDIAFDGRVTAGRR